VYVLLSMCVPHGGGREGPQYKVLLLYQKGCLHSRMLIHPEQTACFATMTAERSGALGGKVLSQAECDQPA
jgi:hypothetical protein